MSDILKLMYVEDDEDIREFADLALEDEGFEVLLCESGQSALDQVLDFKPDLILLDVMMPGMDGPTTLKELRKLPITEQTPIVFLTAKVQPKEVESFMQLGAVDVISKPFDPTELPDRIWEIWSRFRAS